MLPLVSISCVTFNQAPYIRECLDGFLMQQTDFAFEIIINDDASTDGTKEIIEEYTKKYPEIFFPFYQTENQYSKGIRGMMLRFNFPRCRGKYIALCEGDDYWTDPLKLQKQVNFLEENEDVNLCFHRANLLQNNEFILHPIPDGFEGKSFSYIELLRHFNFITTASVVFRKPEKFHFPKWYFSLPFGDLGMYKLFLDEKKIHCLKDVMSVYRIHEKGVWSSLSQIKGHENYLRFYQNIYQALNPEEKKVVKKKAKEVQLEIAKLKFPRNRFFEKLYLYNLFLKF